MSAINKLKEEYPAGSMVYHKASGAAGVVIGWGIRAQGDLILIVDTGVDGWQIEDPTTMSATKQREDGEDWKDGLERS